MLLKSFTFTTQLYSSKTIKMCIGRTCISYSVVQVKLFRSPKSVQAITCTKSELVDDIYIIQQGFAKRFYRIPNFLLKHTGSKSRILLIIHCLRIYTFIISHTLPIQCIYWSRMMTMMMMHQKQEPLLHCLHSAKHNDI